MSDRVTPEWIASVQAANRRKAAARRIREKHDRRNPYGVDAPITRMAFALIYLATGVLPAGFDESWKGRIPPTSGGRR